MPDSPSSTESRRLLAGWGNHPRIRGFELCSEDLEAITRNALLSRGLGRAYGDAALPPPSSWRPVATTRLADRILSFDAETGVLRGEAGLSLATLNRLLLPRGYFTPVSPGTQFVTLGGMVAADVHGKNHHVAGCFGEHVRALKLRVADGRILEINATNEPELFCATLGGMGLTGHILEVEIRMERVPSPWIWQDSERLPEIESVIERLQSASEQWPMTMAWIDTTQRGRALGRGIVFWGRWAEPDEAPSRVPAPRRELSLPFRLPNAVINRHTIRAMNGLWFARHGLKPARGITHPHDYFYPLDTIHDWNRVYGTRGFTQYQCVIPSSGSLYRKLLERFQAGGGASFVTVVKDCGPEGSGLISFPKTGTSIALDIPMQGAKTQGLVDDLNELVIEHAGRIYLAKDALTRPEHFLAMYPRLEEWNAVRRKWDPESRLVSAQSVRLLGDRP